MCSNEQMILTVSPIESLLSTERCSKAPQVLRSGFSYENTPTVSGGSTTVSSLLTKAAATIQQGATNLQQQATSLITDQPLINETGEDKTVKASAGGWIMAALAIGTIMYYLTNDDKSKNSKKESNMNSGLSGTRRTKKAKKVKKRSVKKAKKRSKSRSTKAKTIKL
jgi:hypothetical protein